MVKRVFMILFLLTGLVFCDTIKVSSTRIKVDEAIIKSPQYLAAGDKNGLIDSGEKISLEIALQATLGDFISTSAKISSNDQYIKIITSKVDYNDIQQGRSVWGNNPLVFEIKPDCPHKHVVEFDVKIYDSNKRDPNNRYIEFIEKLKVTVNKVGPIEYSGAIIDDDDIGQSQGNDNKIIEKSDGNIEIPLRLINKGDADVKDARVKLSTESRDIKILESEKPYNLIKGASEAWTPADYLFKVEDNSKVNKIYYLPLKLEITGYFEGYKYDWVHEFGIGDKKLQQEALKELNEKAKDDMILVQGGHSGDFYIIFVQGGPSGDFYIGKTEVTQAQWKAVMGNNPSCFKGDNNPVEKVSWFDAIEFCNKLSDKEGLQKCYAGSGNSITCNFKAKGYRLPTEAEWKYAAKGGNQSRGYTYIGSYNVGDVAWYNGNSRSKTQPVATKNDNELGIHDMSGNVWEWCWNWYVEGSLRAIRGGSWYNGAGDCGVASRHELNPPADRDNYVGFRVARTK
ncbi:MAG: formylglycine-generating enzyme family protein [Candidatus Delongbacteria bacterium]|nr:formylglycine-generating enzyme family protein [Candidatus Delongbacteria bacterium]